MTNKLNIFCALFSNWFHWQVQFYGAHKLRLFTNRLFQSLAIFLWKHKTDWKFTFLYVKLSDFTETLRTQTHTHFAWYLFSKVVTLVCVLFCLMFCYNSFLFFLSLFMFSSSLCSYAILNTHWNVWFQHLIVFGNGFALKCREHFICAHFRMCIIHTNTPDLFMHTAVSVFSSGFFVFLLLVSTRKFIEQNIHWMWKRESYTKTFFPFANLTTTTTPPPPVTMQIIRIYICYINFAHKFTESNKMLISAC